MQTISVQTGVQIRTECTAVKTILRYLRVDRREIAYLRFIFEAYDGIAVLRTIDSRSGLVVLHIAPGCEPDVAGILEDLKKNILIEETTV